MFHAISQNALWEANPNSWQFQDFVGKWNRIQEIISNTFPSRKKNCSQGMGILKRNLWSRETDWHYDGQERTARWAIVNNMNTLLHFFRPRWKKWSMEQKKLSFLAKKRTIICCPISLYEVHRFGSRKSQVSQCNLQNVLQISSRPTQDHES